MCACARRPNVTRLSRVKRVAEKIDAVKRSSRVRHAFENAPTFARLRDSMQMTVDGGRLVVLAAAARFWELSNFVHHVVRQHRSDRFEQMRMPNLRIESVHRPVDKVWGACRFPEINR